jgi:hypothetical protein
MVSSAVIRPLGRALARARLHNRHRPATSLAAYSYRRPPFTFTTRAFSSAQPSSAEEATATPATPFAHKVDERVEEQKRRRLSDVSNRSSSSSSTLPRQRGQYSFGVPLLQDALPSSPSLVTLSACSGPHIRSAQGEAFLPMGRSSYLSNIHRPRSHYLLY